MSLRSFLISLQERDGQGRLLGWNGAVGHAEGLINTEGSFLSILALNASPGSEVYEAGLGPLSSGAGNYSLRPSNVYSAVSGKSQPGYLTSGPDYVYPAGDYQADYLLRCSSPPAGAKIATLSLVASSGVGVAPSLAPGVFLCREYLDGSFFHGGTWVKRTLPFTLARPTPLSLRTYWWGGADMDVAFIQVRRLK